MEAADTLFHVSWGDGDTTFVIAPDKETAIERMPEGKDMINSIVRLDALYQMISKAGERKVVEWLEAHPHILNPYHIEEWQEFLKSEGEDDTG